MPQFYDTGRSSMEFDSGLSVPDLPGYGGESHAEMMERLCNKVREEWTTGDCLDAISEMGAAHEGRLYTLYLRAFDVAWRNDAQTAIADAALGKFIRERIEDYVLRLAEFKVR